MSVKISELEELQHLYDGCCMPVVSYGETKKVTYAKLKEQMLQEFEENDPTVPTHVKDILIEDIDNWNNKVDKSEVKVKEDSANKVTSIDENSTDEQYPSAKLLYKEVTKLKNKTQELKNENEKLTQDLNGVAVNSEELIEESPTLNDSADKVRFKKFSVQGNSVQSEVPTSQVPSEIKNVTSINGKIVCENIFDKNDINNIINNCYLDEAKLSASSGGKTLFVKVKPNTSYTISKIVSSRFSIATTNETPTIGSLIYNRTQQNSAASISITSDSNSKYLVMFYYNPATDTLTEQQILDSIQIEEGSIATPYKPYQEQTFAFPLLDGQKLYSDSYLADDSIHHKRATIRIDENRNWTRYSSGSVDNDEVMQFTATFAGFTYASNQIKCNYFNSLGGKDNSLYGEGIYLHATLGVFYIRIKKSELITQDVAGFKTWLSEHNVVVEYTLVEEDVIPYTAEQKQAYDSLKQLYTYKGTTHVFFEDEVSPKADVIYRKDIGALINNLATAIVAIGGEE